MRHITEMVESDAAPEGMAGAEVLQGDWLPALRLRCWDFAHGARRLLARPWQADGFTQDIVEFVLLGNQSISALIVNS